jgi:uncharacterized SAM-binding protein YcdF (DUF218 family)
MIRRVVFVLVALAIAVSFGAATPLLDALGRYLVNEEPPAPADAIVVLAGSIPDRILEAVALFQDGLAPRIVISRGRVPPSMLQLQRLGVHMPTFAELNRTIAEKLGVDTAAIVEVGGTEDSTVDEAEAVLRFALAQGYGTLMVVTSKYHSRRASLIYRHLAPERVRIVSRPSRYDEFEPRGWWRDRTFRRRVIIEYQKLFAFQLMDRWQFPPIAALPTFSAEHR